MISMKEKRDLKDVRAVFTDIDGTLLDSEERLSGENLKAIQEVVNRGILMVFASGRSTRSIRNLFTGLDERNFNAIAFNGSEVTLRGEVVSRTMLDSATASQIVRTVSEINIHIHAYVDGELVFSRMTPTAEKYAIHTGLEPIIAGDLAGYLQEHPPIKLVVLSESDYLPSLKEKLTGQFAGVSFTRSGGIYLDITCSNVDKGRGLIEICKREGIAPENTVAFGDSDNDIEMLKAAGLSVAMSNGSEEVRRVATAKTASNDENGFSKMIRKLLRNLTP
jgi:Cof subfamily protein (haloacid dehalogenase superfamily)